MAIRIEENPKNFYLETKNSMYQIQADSRGVLKHIWYGRRTGRDMSYLLDYHDVGFSGNTYDAGEDRTYSLDTMPLEYAAEGIGDFRVAAVAVTHGNGGNALDLRYESHRVYRGKEGIPGLPYVYAGDADVETLEIVLKDTAGEVRVALRYGVFEKLDVVTRSAVIENCGPGPKMLTKAHTVCIDMPWGDWEWVHFHGRHTMERQVQRLPLLSGIQESSSKRGASSHQQNPTVLLCEKDCTEDRGGCFGAALMYSGCFQTQIERDQLGQVRLVMGLHPDTFRWKLEAGAAFYTPEAILSWSDQGFAGLSHQFHRVIREHVCRGKYKLAERPVLINNWEATYFSFDEEKLYNIAEQAAKLGVDMLVMDDGWFGVRGSDSSGLGDWYVNERKLKGGLAKLVQKIRGLGMSFGIWLEPEMVSEDSDLYRAHPEWAIRIPGRQPMRGRYQLVLDMSREDVREYLYEAISSLLRSADISYIKWDMNRNVCDWYSTLLPPDRQGEAPHRYVLGLYELLERLNTDFPDVLFEGCCGGGGRFDAGMLYYCPQIWCSDDTDAYARTKIQYGTSFFYPVSTIGSHVSAVPNHQTGRVTPLSARAVTAMAGSFGYELDLNTLTEEEKEAVKDQISRFREYGPLIHNGHYYRLSDPQKENRGIWSFVEKDQSAALVQGVLFHAEPNMVGHPVRLKGLKKEALYRIRETGEVYTGAALMHGGILLPRGWGDYMAVEYYLETVEP